MRSASQTNNVAEYTALLNGLRRAAELGVTEVEVVSDSELMVKQMRGEYKIKNAALRELSIEATRLARAVGDVRYTAVRREHNKLADQLVNDALDAACVERRAGVARRLSVSWMRMMFSDTRSDRSAAFGLLALALLLPR